VLDLPNERRRHQAAFERIQAHSWVDESVSRGELLASRTIKFALPVPSLSAPFRPFPPYSALAPRGHIEHLARR